MPGMLEAKREVQWLTDDQAIVKTWSIMGGDPQIRILNMTKENYNLWRSGESIQKALGSLSAEEREWLMTGIDGETFTRMFKEDE